MTPNAIRYAVEIAGLDRHHNDITRYLCRSRGHLFAPSEPLAQLEAGNNLATYTTAARARAEYNKFYLRVGKSLGCTPAIRIFPVNQ